MMGKKQIKALVFFSIIMVFACKPKLELYLERGLDILSNKEVVNFNLTEDVLVKELGIIRDQKENIKTLVLKMDNTVKQSSFKGGETLGIRVWIEDKNGVMRKENWDFVPELTIVNEHKYIVKQVNVKEDLIKRMRIHIYTEVEGKKTPLGPMLQLHKVNTYND